ncbi:MAG TPA: TIGR00341 family protein [Candidatus Thermoplasmatota archaeon]|nr:TIGR00341 family protein [Candidatus Thermoplasmatota archaeon]
MALRLIEIYGLTEKQKNIESLLEDITLFGIWQDKLPDKKRVTRILIDSEQTEPLLELFEKKYDKNSDFRIIVLPVEASIPRPDKDKIKAHEKKTKERLSIEELYQTITEQATISKTFFYLIILAAIVASIGVLYNNVAVIIGSMVIAPLLSSSMALSLATTLADKKLAREALITSIAGYIIAISIGIIFGIFFTINPNATEIVSRTDVNLMYIILALASGIAGSLSFTKGISQALVGVIVAVALLPPLIVTGLLIGSLQFNQALGSFLLFSVNVVCINLASVITFLSQGINPKKWWEKEKAKHTTQRALIIWTSMLLILILLILLYQFVSGGL